MPIKIQSDLPVKEILEKENIFVMDESRASHQDIRPKPETEPQLSYALHSRKQRLRRIMPTAHGLQHVRAPALERQVQVRADHAGFGKRGDAPFRKLRGFHGTDAETRRIGPGAAPPLRSQFSVQIGQQIPKIPAPLVTHGVLAQVDAGNHDLAVARLKQAAQFGKAILRRAAPGRASRGQCNRRTRASSRPAP